MILIWTIVLAIFYAVIFVIFFKKNGSNEKNFFTQDNGLSWPLIGFSIIAANISTEHFIGMAGSGYKVGLPIASHEWTAIIALVIIAIYILPKYMSVGAKTIPEYLEFRFNHWTRLITAVFLLFFLIFIQFASIIYQGSLAIETLFGINGIWIFNILGLITIFFTLTQGFAFTVRSNIIFAITFLIGGLIVLYEGINYVGGIDSFIEKSENKLIALLPANDTFLPWTVALLGGLRVSQFFYFGFNPFVTQYLLSGKSLSEAQKGMLFAASIKLVIPFIVIFPGIISFEIFGSSFTNPDFAFPKLVEFLSTYFPTLKIIIFCTLFAAAISTLNSILIASSSIFTNDIYIRYFNKNADQRTIALVGRISLLTILIIGCAWAPMLDSQTGSFYYVKKLSLMISPGILCVFAIAMFTKKIPSFVALTTLLLNLPIYFLIITFFPTLSFYDLIGITFLILLIIAFILGNLFPLKKEIIMPEKLQIKFERNLIVIVWSIFLITFIFFLYMLFL